jgi:hypothetical protein
VAPVQGMQGEVEIIYQILGLDRQRRCFSPSSFFLPVNYLRTYRSMVEGQADEACGCPMAMGVARLADMPAEWSGQHQMLGHLRVRQYRMLGLPRPA